MSIFEMCNIRFGIDKIRVIAIFLLGFIFLPVLCHASWTNTPGMYSHIAKKLVCPETPDTNLNLDESDYIMQGCEFTVGDGNTVPSSDRYTIVLAVVDSTGEYKLNLISANKYIDAGVELNTLNLDWTVLNRLMITYPANHICYMLSNYYSGLNYTFNNTPQSCPEGSGGSTPLPPPFHCAFGDGSTLNISLGNVDRAEIGTVPGTLSGTEKNISITCTGDGSATYTIGFEYTPINIAGTEMISSTTNGLAVAMSLNDKLVNPADTYSRTYSTGTQTEKLTFEPIRDPSVKIGDIQTGAFSANAVMILTVQ
ncbi:fimbrial protein [Enterobacter vonholyi]|uniref:fimbrial protein n=1 Tax=Enterobacter vonholyi TaxID=2797505 RepID=UPI0020BDCA70|nr:fimbrial protein [Enterobacter vonholyi]MCL5636776.1 fimbrial protein [Enterobacter vonholyi]